MLEQADRARKMAEQELSDTSEALADLTMQNQVTQLGKFIKTLYRGDLSTGLVYPNGSNMFDH